MTLSAGSRLGPYEIVSPLGAGGMGEVYRAKDTRLERTVAIKVLPQQLSSSPEERQRFEREAKTISQLSHPHICALYDVGNQDGVEYLVMEYLEGETLSNRLLKGALPFDQVIRCGIEIADALDKAHRIACGAAVMSVPVKTDAGNFEPGSSVPLFRIDSTNLGGYDVSTDGQRFLTSSGTGLGSQPITVILNWTAEQKK
jgi:hypothetical protein